jgi:hypothetical protein
MQPSRIPRGLRFRRVFATLILLIGVAPLASPADDVGVSAAFYGLAYEQADVMAAAGIRWVRLDLDWSAAERLPGVYDFSIWDRFIASLEPRGMRTLLILDYGNDLYEGRFPPTTNEGRAAFAAFAGAAARHYKGRVAWEIWNEPNLPRFWAGAPDAGAYVALARAAAKAIRREDPNAWILGPALGGGFFDLPYLEATFAAGLLDVVDAVSVHPYGASHPEAAAPFYQQVRDLIGFYGSKAPLVVSEWGYPAEQLGQDAQADLLRRCFAVNRAAGIPLTIWFNWQEPVGYWNSFGLLDIRGRPKPAYRVLQELAAAEAKLAPKR